MAINKNHEFEELDGIKCAIVQKAASAERTIFLKDLLTYNGYTVVVVQTPVPPAKPVPPPVEGQEPAPAPATYTIGVTDLTFNPTNAIFGRLLKASNGSAVTLAYWNQQEAVANDAMPYFEKSNN